MDNGLTLICGSNNAPTTLSNVLPFKQSLAWHAAATHVLDRALTTARSRGLISLDASDELLEHANRRMNVAEVRHTIGLVLSKLEATTP